jgi:transcriptional regulator GlxA family with amidase domain
VNTENGHGGLFEKTVIAYQKTKKIRLTRVQKRDSFRLSNSLPMSPKAFTKEEKARLFQTKTFLLTHLQEDLDVARLARHAALGSQRFMDGFALLFDYTPGRYLHEARMQTGLVLLKHTDKTVKEIAALCGYRHYKNFLTAFKSFFGRRPSDVRP